MILARFTAQRAKVYELILFNNILVQLFRSSFGSFFLVSVIFDIQTDLKMKHLYLWNPILKHIQNLVKHPI